MNADTAHRNRSVCYFGAFPKPYARNTVIRAGLERRGVGVVECRVGPGNVLSRYAGLLARFLRNGRGCDAILVGDGRHLDVPLAKLLGRLFGKKVILDAFISHYDSWVLDRTEFPPWGRRAVTLALADSLCARLADAVLMDTQAHVDFYSELFRVPSGKFRVVFISAPDDTFKPSPLPAPDGTFKVLHHGNFIPLHGMEYILRAAKILEGRSDIVFNLVGGQGYVYEKAVKLHNELGLKNTVFHPREDQDGIARRLADCDVCLGIFGASAKASRVIPNKAYEALAAGRPLLTANTPGARELLSDRVDALLCLPACPESIAESILELKNNPGLRNTIAQNGYKLYKERLLPEIVVQPIIDLI